MFFLLWPIILERLYPDLTWLALHVVLVVKTDWSDIFGLLIGKFDQFHHRVVQDFKWNRRLFDPSVWHFKLQFSEMFIILDSLDVHLFVWGWCLRSCCDRQRVACLSDSHKLFVDDIFFIFSVRIVCVYLGWKSLFVEDCLLGAIPHSLTFFGVGVLHLEVSFIWRHKFPTDLGARVGSWRNYLNFHESIDWFIWSIIGLNLEFEVAWLLSLLKKRCRAETLLFLRWFINWWERTID